MAMTGELSVHQWLDPEVISLLVTSLSIRAAFGCLVDVKGLCLTHTALCVTWDLKIKVLYILFFNPIRIIQPTNNYARY